MDGEHGNDQRPDARGDTVEANLRDGYRLEAVDVNGDGKPDLIASRSTQRNGSGRWTPGYFLADDPRVMVFLDRFEQFGR